MTKDPGRRQHSTVSRRKDGHKSRIAIIGSGVVGQATGVGLLKKGFDVTFVDNNVETVDALNSKRYKATLTDGLDPQNVDVFFVSVPTYISDDDEGVSYIRTTAENLGVWISKKSDYSLIVIRSTILPGTTEKVIIPTVEKYSCKKAGKDFGVCVNPEYLREKSAGSDFMKPWVVVIGEMDKRDGDILQDIYSWVVCPVHRVSVREAEMQKFVHNLFNANKISFFNEMRQSCRELCINCSKMFQLVTESAEGMWNPAYGTKNLGPFSGSCLPKDSKAFQRFAKENLRIEMRMLQAMLELNEQMIKNDKLRTR